MRYLKGGATGLAAIVAFAVIMALIPGAQASRQAAGSSAQLSRQQAVTALQASQQSTQSKAGTLTSRVRGTFGRAGIVRGTFHPKRFIYRAGKTYAVGTLHATLRRANGTLVGRAHRQVTLPVRHGAVSKTGQSAVALADCQILDLVLGPLDLNLLGLKVHLNRVVLHIVASPGPGALLGNLLCAVAGLLDSTGLTGLLRLTNLLNRILSVLRL